LAANGHRADDAQTLKEESNLQDFTFHGTISQKKRLYGSGTPSDVIFRLAIKANE
jgi:hypothetical protein